MKTLCTILIAFVFTISNSKAANFQSLFDSYLKVKEALVKSDAQKASLYAKEFSVLINKIDPVQLPSNQEKEFNLEKENLLKTSLKIAKMNDLEKQREVFATLSTSMWKLIKISNNLSSNAYYQYCPMKKAYWISSASEIENPYYGVKMLSCGSIKEKNIK